MENCSAGFDATPRRAAAGGVLELQAGREHAAGARCAWLQAHRERISRIVALPMLRPTLLRALCVLALVHGGSAGIFNIFQSSPPPAPPPPPLPPVSPPPPPPPSPPPACPAGQYKFTTSWLAPVAASIATRFGVPMVRGTGSCACHVADMTSSQATAQVGAASLVASVSPSLAPLVGTCQPCAPGCAACTSAAMCSQCDAGSVLVTLSSLADGLVGTPPPAAPPPPATVASALAAAALASSIAAGNVTLCLPLTQGYGLEGLFGAAACAVLPASAAALFPACAAAPPPPLPGARVGGNATNATAPPVSALAGPPASARCVPALWISRPFCAC